MFSLYAYIHVMSHNSKLTSFLSDSYCTHFNEIGDSLAELWSQFRNFISLSQSTQHRKI